ncbi:hypothetical protein IL992_02440 [Microbispora sp. NEAU-D428]|uniref:hypothetical protein n=1 Tax=Microbispora sitophila TaxID=2771537 RepID=UPI0018683DB9|nr:hypothetical protein [Microbispora sitophila]MBE3008051.1 hypothetical protein [Microbispora sitophila]
MEVAREPAKSSKPRLPKDEWAATKELVFDLATQGCQIQQGDPTQLKTIEGWRSTPYLEHLVNTP